MYKEAEKLPWVQDSIIGIEHDAIEWLYWLSGRSRSATVSLIALPWMQDSITDTERDALEWLFWLADEDRDAYEEAVAKPFLKSLGADDVLTLRRMSGRESESYMGRLSSSYPEVANLLRDLPWARNPATETELDTIEWLYWLARESQNVAVTVAALPWVQDGATHTERTAIRSLYWLLKEDEKLAAKVIALSWTQDAITVTELEAIKQLDWMSRQENGNSTANLEAVLRFSWVQDGVTETEVEFLKRLQYLDDDYRELASKVIAFPWPQDGITETELDAMKQLYWLTRQEGDRRNAANLEAVLRFPWVQDSITGTEAEFLDFLEALDDRNEKVAAAVIVMPWIQDDITETEGEAIKRIYWLKDEDDENSLAVIEAVLALPWIHDGITKMEGEAIDRIESLDDRSEEAAAAVIAMPFLESLEADDLLAIRGIRRLVRESDDGRLDALMDHSALRNGITDAQTTLVTAAGTLRDAEEVRQMLNPGYADIEVLAEGTELTPNLKISIARTGSQRQPWTAEGVRDAVEFVEETMQLPLPVSHVLVVLNDKAFTENYGGTNFGFALSCDPENEQPRDTNDGHNFQSCLVHETAHYFWRGMENWVDEGVADTFEYMYGVETGVSPGLLERPRRKTSSRECEAHDMEMLTEWNPGQQELDRFHCNYYLGQSLFLELLENMGQQEFNAGLRELYRLSLAAKDADETPGIAEVRQAFRDQAEIVEKHWSGKLNAPENRPFDEGVFRSSHSLIQWDQYPTYDGDSVTFGGTLLGDAVLMSETIEQAREFNRLSDFTLSRVDEFEFLGTILAPRNDSRSWSLDDPGDTVATEFRLEEGKFTIKFPVRQGLGSPSDYVVIVWGFQDESREPFIYDNIDILGYARIRVE